MNKKRICLVTSGHPPFDERIFWKFGKTLTEAGFSVSIFCSTLEIKQTVEGIRLIGFDGSRFSKRAKINVFNELIKQFNPDLIICSQMLPIFSALQFRKQHTNAKIILDITEWFPENVAFKFSGFKRWTKYMQLFIPYIYAIQYVDHLIIGEIIKKKRYDILASSKPKTIIGYYPVLKYFNYSTPDLSKAEVIFGYAGVITYERGIKNLLESTLSIAQKYPQKKFKLVLFGRFTYKDEENEFKDNAASINNFKVEYNDWTGYNNMSPVIEKMDLCFDLRERNFIYNNSLPIKIFEYMACGKPFIYSDINPIRVELDYKNYGQLIDPANKDEIINVIENYLNNPELVNQHSRNARKLIEQSSNWENESRKLIELVNKLLA